MEFKSKENTGTKKRTRNRKIIYYCPPYSKSVKKDIGRKFLSLIDECFPKGSVLYKIFNRRKVKISYCTMPNIKNHIDKHNARILNKVEITEEDEQCNCKKKENEEEVKCPLTIKGKKKCLTKGVVYKAVVQCKNRLGQKIPSKIYYGSTERTFKDQYNEHQTSINNEKYKNKTTLSTYIWKLKNIGLKPEIKWSIKARGHVFSSGSRSCDLCLTEKLTILQADPKVTVNSRDEILEKCRHKKKYTLHTVEPKAPRQKPPNRRGNT